MNYAQLKARLLALIGRAPNDVVYELVTADINQELRLRGMQATVTLTEAATVALPSDFLKMVSLYRDTNPRTTLLPLDSDTLQRRYEASGVPCRYSIEDGQMTISPAPNGSENLVMRYVAKVQDLAADTDTNPILTDFPSVYVYGALAHHAALIRDQEALGAWFSAYEKAKMQARQADNKYKAGSGPIVPTPRSVA